MKNEKEKEKDGMLTMIDAIVYRINSLCEENNMSIYELSYLSGVSQSTLNEIMQGRSSRPRIDTVNKIAYNGFGINITEFFNDPIFDHIKGVHDQEPKERLKKHRKKKKSSDSDNEDITH